MAIVDMDKLSLVGLESEKDQILRFLMKRGFVQIDDSSDLIDEVNTKDFLKNDGDSEAVSIYEQKLSVLSQAMTTLEKLSKRKKPLFAKPRPSEKLTSTEVADLYSFAEEINDLERRIIELKASENALKTKIDSLSPWSSLNIPLDNLETKFTTTILGTIPTKVNLEDAEIKLVNEAPESTIGIVESDKLSSYIYLISHKAVFDKALDTLKEFGFAPIVFNDCVGTPSEIIKNCGHMIAKSENERSDINADLSKRAEKLSELERLYDYFNMEREQANIKSNIVKTKATFTFNGWIPSNISSEFEKEITSKFDCCVYLKRGNKKEGIPILLENKTLVRPFETITTMYSLPHSSNVDPNFVMSIFYFIFFGMMLSDAGYGLIMTIACGYAALKYKPQGETGKMVEMFALCGISTTVWGFIFGSFFGADTIFGIAIPKLLDPLNDVMTIMGISIIFGLIHLFTGLGMKAYMYIREGKFLDIIWDVVSWYLFILGLVIIIAPIVVTFEIPQAVITIGNYMAIGGAILLVLTQGRDKNGLIFKALGGLKSLYDVTGYFSDILSYLRLTALCLSTGVIAMVINLLRDMAGPIFGTLIFLFGHTINLLINALGAYVHTSRLQYVEFFAKFYEGGGKAFNPFKLKSKYVTFKEEK